MLSEGALHCTQVGPELAAGYKAPVAGDRFLWSAMKDIHRTNADHGLFRGNLPITIGGRSTGAPFVSRLRTEFTSGLMDQV